MALDRYTANCNFGQNTSDVFIVTANTYQEAAAIAAAAFDQNTVVTLANGATRFAGRLAFSGGKNTIGSNSLPISVTVTPVSINQFLANGTWTLSVPTVALGSPVSATYG